MYGNFCKINVINVSQYSMSGSYKQNFMIPQIRVFFFPKSPRLSDCAVVFWEDLEAEVLGIQSAMCCSQGHQF